jgi:hypothetical protein
MNESYRQLGQSLRDAKVKYAFVVLQDDSVIEIGNQFTRQIALDRVGSSK